MIDRRRGQGMQTWRLGAGIALAVAAAAAGAQAQTPPPATGGAAAPAAAPAARKGPPAAVTFYGSPTSPISGGVAIPAGAAFVWTSGTVPPVAKADAPAGRHRALRRHEDASRRRAQGHRDATRGAGPDDGRRGLPARLPRRRSRQGRPSTPTAGTPPTGRCSARPPTRPSRRARRSASRRSSTRSG